MKKVNSIVIVIIAVLMSWVLAYGGDNKSNTLKIDLLLILFGWFLGILSTFGIELIRKYVRKKEFEKGGLAELREIR